MSECSPVRLSMSARNQPRHDLKTCPTVVVRALPRIDFVFVLARDAFARNLPEPSPMVVVDDVFVDEIPTSLRCSAKVLLPGKLIRIQKPHNSLRLRPPVLVAVNDPAVFGLIEQAPVAVQCFVVHGL